MVLVPFAEAEGSRLPGAKPGRPMSKGMDPRLRMSGMTITHRLPIRICGNTEMGEMPANHCRDDDSGEVVFFSLRVGLAEYFRYSTDR